jgi:hypothetical protein
MILGFWLLSSILVLTINFALAVDYRWTLGFAQGTSEAIIRNESGSSVNIYCPAGQIDTTPGMFVNVSRVRPKPREQITIQIVVDGKSFPFDLDEIQYIATGRANREALASLVSAFAGSKGRSFVVEFPKFGMAERFSLVDVRRAVGSGRGSVLDGC